MVNSIATLAAYTSLTYAGVAASIQITSSAVILIPAPLYLTYLTLRHRSRARQGKIGFTIDEQRDYNQGYLTDALKDAYKTLEKLITTKR